MQLTNYGQKAAVNATWVSGRHGSSGHAAFSGRRVLLGGQRFDWWVSNVSGSSGHVRPHTCSCVRSVALGVTWLMRILYYIYKNLLIVLIMNVDVNGRNNNEREHCLSQKRVWHSLRCLLPCCCYLLCFCKAGEAVAHAHCTVDVDVAMVMFSCEKVTESSACVTDVLRLQLCCTCKVDVLCSLQSIRLPSF